MAIAHATIAEPRSTRTFQPLASPRAAHSTGPPHAAYQQLVSGHVPAGVLTPVEVLVRPDAARQAQHRLASVPGIATVAAPAAADSNRSGTMVLVAIPRTANLNSSQSTAVTVLFYPLGSKGAPQTAALTLDPGASQVIPDVLGTLFGVDPGQGTLQVLSDVPVASSLRIASSKPEGDFATLALPIDPDGIVRPGGSAFVIGAPQTPIRRTNLLLFNRGAAGTVTAIAYNGNNSEIGRRQFAVDDHQAIRVDSVMAAVGVDEETNGRLVVEASDGMLLYAWAAEVDGPTGDVEIIPFR